MTAKEALELVEKLHTDLTFLAECWKEEPDKNTFREYEAKIRKMFPRVLVEKVTQRPFGFILRAQDQRLQVKYLMHNPKIARVDTFSEIGRAARRKTNK
jgi:hypothetical protein